MEKFIHAYAVAFDLSSQHAIGEDVTAAQLRQAIITKFASISDEELLECAGAPFDTYAIEGHTGEQDNRATFSAAMEGLIATAKQLVNQCVPQKGNAHYECQHIALMSALQSLEIIAAGMVTGDFIADPDWEATNRNAGFNFDGEPTKKL